MKEIVKVFNNEKIRCFVLKNNPYFSLSDVCKVLGMKNPSNVLAYLKKDYICTTYVIDSMNRQQEIYIVNEYGLYEMIFKSRKEEAKIFKEWVFEEVLPSIRKTGQYSIPNEVKKLSTEKRNILTSEWKAHGIEKPYEYIRLTLQEYNSLGFGDKKKKDLNQRELLLLSALESMEAFKLFENMDVNGYYECKDSLIETAENIKKVLVVKND